MSRSYIVREFMNYILNTSKVVTNITFWTFQRILDNNHQVFNTLKVCHSMIRSIIFSYFVYIYTKSPFYRSYIIIYPFFGFGMSSHIHRINTGRVFSNMCVFIWTYPCLWKTFPCLLGIVTLCKSLLLPSNVNPMSYMNSEM